MMKKSFDKIRSPMAGAPVDPPADQPADTDLQQDLQARIAADGRLANEQFEVAVEDGCAVLSGRVSREFLRQLINAHASAVAGVHVVKDQLTVAEPGPMTGPPE